MTDPWGVLFVAVWVLLAVVLVVGALRAPAEPASRPSSAPRPSGAAGRAVARPARPSTLVAGR